MINIMNWLGWDSEPRCINSYISMSENVIHMQSSRCDLHGVGSYVTQTGL